jgi:hypothetical protein
MLILGQVEVMDPFPAGVQLGEHKKVFDVGAELVLVKGDHAGAILAAFSLTAVVLPFTPMSTDSGGRCRFT